MPSYPTAPKTFPTRVDGELIFADHMNQVQEEIAAIEQGLLVGFQHDLLPFSDLAHDLGSAGRRWNEIWAGKVTVQDLVVTGSVVLPPVPPPTFIDLPELVPPAPGDPAANVGRLHALDANGFTVLEVRDSNANVVRLASDNVLIGKVTVAGGIARGQAVYISGAAGANPLLGLAKADAAATLPCLGLALDPGANNAFIRVLLGGTIQIINTSAFAEGDRLFVSPTTAGALINTLPTPPAFAQRIGIVTRAHATQGEIVVVTTGVEAPPVATPPTPHAPSHASGGGDPVNLLGLAGYPGGTGTFLRADGAFTSVPGSSIVGVIPGASVPNPLPAVSGQNLTNLPAANLVGVIPAASVPNPLPAVSGANLTNLPAANLVGVIPNGAVPNPLPAVSGANLTALPSVLLHPDYTFLPYTPTWTSDGGTNPVLGNGTLTGHYLKIGKLVWFSINLSIGSTTTFGVGQWLFGFPFTAFGFETVGAAIVYVGAFHPCIWRTAGGFVGCVLYNDGSGGGVNGATYGWLAGHAVFLSGVFRTN